MLVTIKYNKLLNYYNLLITIKLIIKYNNLKNFKNIVNKICRLNLNTYYCV